MEESNTRQLIKLYRRSGSSKALDILVRNHQQALTLAASKTPSNIMLFEDKIQFGNIILLKLISKDFDLRRKIKFVTYLIQIVNFRLIDEIRKQLRKLPDRSINDIDCRSGSSLTEQIENKDLQTQMVNEIAKLPRTEQIVMGCLYLGMSQNEIAKQCGVTTGYISQIVNKSKKKLLVSLT